MYERLSARTDKVIKLAHQIAREYDQEYVGTEHILLAIMREGTGIGARVLARHGVTNENLRAQVDSLIKKSAEETWVFGRLPGTPHFRNVVASAIEQAQQLESREVCTEHLLLGLLRENGSVAHRALTNLGIHHGDARETVLQLCSED